jgi:4-hydroxybenzoate polyprenyltransferase
MLVSNLFRLCRPHHWSKNAFCFAGPLFSTQAVSPDSWALVGLVFVGFCLAASSAYVLNDLADAKADRANPLKATRPIASGSVPKSVAVALLVALLGMTVAVTTRLPAQSAAAIGAYLLVNLAYSLWLKHLAILDVFCISAGFLLRLAAGVYAIGDTPTAWIVLCTLFVTLFLGFAKRRSELALLGRSSDGATRRVLTAYSVEYLDFLVSATSTMTIVTYALFTTSGGRDPTMVLTVFPVVYAVFHYKRTMMLGSGTDSPDRFVLRDPVVWACVVVWLLAFLAIDDLRPGLLR